MPSSWPAQSRQVPCCFQSFNLRPHLTNAPSPPIVGECSLDSPANCHDCTRQARAAAMAADTSSSSTSSGSRAARRTRPRKAGAAERAPAACSGAFALAADVSAGCAGAPRPNSAASAEKQTSTPPSNTGTSSVGGRPTRRRACEQAGGDAAKRRRSRGAGSTLPPSAQSESAMGDGAEQASCGSSDSNQPCSTSSLTPSAQSESTMGDGAGQIHPGSTAPPSAPSAAGSRRRQHNEVKSLSLSRLDATVTLATWGPQLP